LGDGRREESWEFVCISKSKTAVWEQAGNGKQKRKRKREGKSDSTKVLGGAGQRWAKALSKALRS